MNYIYAYYQKIQDGSIIAGAWIKLLYGKIISNLETGEYHFDQKKADNAIKFVERYVKHNKGKLAPGQLILSLWQKAALSVIFGIVDEHGKRQFREIFMVIGRKCGKTLFAAAIIAYIAYIGGEFGSEIYCVAPKLDQSDLVYSAFRFTVDHTPAFSSRTRPRKTDLYIAETNTTIKKIAFNEKKADGYNPMLTVCDEMSSWPGDRGLKQYEVMVSGTGAREEPITLAISSSGYVNEGIFDELMKRSTRFLKGDSREQRLLPFLYMIDDIEKWNDINELQKSLPGLGVSVSVDFILDQIAVAEGSLSKKAEFITKYCDLKQNSSQAWIDMQTANKCRGAALRLEDFRGCYCVGGIDLSMSTDLTACCVLIERDGIVNMFTQFFLPSAKIDEATIRDGLPYRQYITRGILTESGENYVDYQDCYRWFVDLLEKYEIYPLWVGYDKYSAQPLVQQMEIYGFHMDSVTQGENLTGIINTTEGMLKDGVINIGDNDLMAVHMLDAALKSNAETGRKKLIKMSASAHVDGMAALLDAMLVRQIHYDEIGEQLKNTG